MKRFLIIGILVCITSISQGEGIAFFKGSFVEAVKEAVKQNKLLFVDAYADWCGPCKIMSEQVFSLQEVGAYFNEKFVCYQLDVDRVENKSAVEKYKIQGLPTLLFVEQDGNVVKQHMGAVDSHLLLRLARVANHEQKTPDELYDIYKKDKADFETQRSILLDAPYFMQELQGTQQERWVQRLKNLQDGYFKNKAMEEMVNREDFNLITLYHDRMDKEDRMIDFMVNHFSDYASVVDSMSVAQYLTAIHSNSVIELARGGDINYVAVAERMTGDMKPIYVILFPDPDKYHVMYKTIADANYAIYHEKNTAKYIDLMETFLKQYGKPQANEYAMVVETLFNGLKGKVTKEGYNKSIEWLDEALKGQVDVEMQVGMVMTMGDCFLGLENQVKAKECYNQAYLLTLKSQNQRFIMKMQAVLKQKLSKTE